MMMPGGAVVRRGLMIVLLAWTAAPVRLILMPGARSRTRTTAAGAAALTARGAAHARVAGCGVRRHGGGGRHGDGDVREAEAWRRLGG